MFSVLFEVHPKTEQWEAYLGYAKQLRPQLERTEGFVDNIRYASLTRDGWILSLSSWRDEKALVRWRVQAEHHEVQERGRSEVFADYRLRVGQLTRDTRPPEGESLVEQRLDETRTGRGTTTVLIDAKRPSELDDEPTAEDLGRWLGLHPDAPGLVSWDVYDAVLTPGDLILEMTWRDARAAEAYERAVDLAEDARLRRVRIVRDYGMFDRRETPQYHPDVPA
jgi:heme-degrading monooxygenase HmoA